MTITLTLTPEEQTALQQRAAAAGTDLTGFIREVLHEKLEEPTPPEVVISSYEEWHREFQSWIASHEFRNPQFDDSRGSIYD